MKKIIEYSYPSSTNAVTMKVGNKGAWHVSLATDNWSEQKDILIPYATKEEAIKVANQMPEQWHWAAFKY